MLVRFNFSNFRSFKDRQELSFVAASISDGPEIPRGVGALKERILPVAGIYGANASGKTNVLRALGFMSQAVSQSHSAWKPDAAIPCPPFADQAVPQYPSEFEIEFMVEGVRYCYGFRLTTVAVTEEWLHVYPRGKKQIWFSRSEGRPMTFSSKLLGENKTIEQLTRQNSLYLSAAAQNNHEALLVPYRWISGIHFELNYPSGKTASQTMQMCKSPDSFEQVQNLLALADLGVVGARIQPVTASRYARNIVGAILDSVTEKHEYDRTKIAIGELEDIQLVHRIGAHEVPFSQEEESKGTLEYLRLLGPVIEILRTGGVLVIDELDGSLHPLLSAQLIRLFNEPETNPRNAQLVFNTHDTNLLSSGLLRRDQIWFTEKSRDGASHLFPLSDFKLRKTDNIETGYLTGRYGAIPFVNASEFLVRFEDAIGPR